MATIVFLMTTPTETSSYTSLGDICVRSGELQGGGAKGEGVAAAIFLFWRHMQYHNSGNCA